MAKSATAAATTDTADFIRPPEFVTKTDGQKHPVPKLSLGDEEKLFDVLKGILVQMIDAGFFVERGPEPVDQKADTVKVANLLFGSGVTTIIEATAIILQQEPNWVRQNVQLKEALGLVVPFLQTELRDLGSLIAGLVAAATQSSSGTG